MKKKILLISLALLLAIGLIASSCAKPAPAPAPAPAPTPAPAPAPKPTYTWTFAVDQNLEHPQVQAMIKFAERVYELSDKRISIDVKHSGVLGDWTQVYEEVIRGTTEMTASPLASIYDPRLDVVYIPSIAGNWEQAKVLYSPGGYVFDTAAEINHNVGVDIMAVFPLGFIGMGTNKEAPSPGDPSVPKDVKVRVWPAKPPQLLIEALGFIVTPMPWSDVFTSMQTGVIDGYFGADIGTAYDLVRDVTKYWYPYRGFFEANWWNVSADLWASLSDEDKGIIMKAAQEAQAQQTADAEAHEIESANKFRDYGIKVAEFTPEEYAKFKEVAVEKVWPEMNSLLGKDIMDEAKEAAAKL